VQEKMKEIALESIVFLVVHEEEGTVQLKEGCLQAASGVAKFFMKVVI
jgi:hypothetical protein